MNAVSCDGDNLCVAHRIYSFGDVFVGGRLRLSGRSGIEKPLDLNKIYYLCIGEDNNVYRSTSPCVWFYSNNLL